MYMYTYIQHLHMYIFTFQMYMCKYVYDYICMYIYIYIYINLYIHMYICTYIFEPASEQGTYIMCKQNIFIYKSLYLYTRCVPSKSLMSSPAYKKNTHIPIGFHSQFSIVFNPRILNIVFISVIAPRMQCLLLSLIVYYSNSQDMSEFQSQSTLASSILVFTTVILP